jgi:Na+-translocating ferredoxin:NAD+ oxidoreductase RnfC subunit
MSMQREKLLQQIRDAGVIGAGGAGFPTYKKLSATVEHVIANGAECEPLLHKDRATMLHSREELLRGLEIMRDVTGAREVTIAVKRKNQDVIEEFGDAIARSGFRTFVYEDVYPAGDEYCLVYEVTGRQIPPGGIPVQVGCLVDNVETIVNVARAVADEPVVDKYVTITGAVSKPVTTVVPVGTRFQECLELAGGITVDDPAILISGVMMGGITRDVQRPITKTTAGLIVLPADHYLVRRKSAARETYTRIGHGQCDQCSMCTELCPRYILGYPIQPHLVMRTLLMTGQAKERGSLWAQYCCECNVCSYIACPEQLDPKNICVDAKALLREKKTGRTEVELRDLFSAPHPARKGREVPIQTLYSRLGLTPYDRKPEFIPAGWQPRQVSIPLNSHIGRPATPAVREGDEVRRGDVIANVEDAQLGCPAHASIAGRVTAVGPQAIEISA